MAERYRNIDTHEVPTYKYIYISGVAIHKSFFAYWTMFVSAFTLSSTLVAVYTDWWQTLIAMLLLFFYIQHWYIGWPATGTLILVGWWLYRRRQRKLRQEQQRRIRERQIQQYIDGGGERKK